MKINLLSFLASLALVFLLQVTCESSFAQNPAVSHPAGMVAHCFDGDTMKLRDRRIIRLAGIDAPEVPHRDQKGQFYAKQSKELLKKLVKGKVVKLEFPGINIKDKYGRLIVEAFLEDGKSVNEILIEKGAAFFYPHDDLDPEFQEKLRQLQATAIQERRGFWNDLLDMPFASDSYFGNRQSRRFFPANCMEATAIKPRNKVHFGNLMDAFLAGYAPARICVFWPQE